MESLFENKTKDLSNVLEKTKEKEKDFITSSQFCYIYNLNGMWIDKRLKIRWNFKRIKNNMLHLFVKLRVRVKRQRPLN